MGRGAVTDGVPLRDAASPAPVVRSPPLGDIGADGCQRTPVSAAVKTLIDGQAAPDFHLKDAWGQDTQVSALKGKVVLLNFWAT